MAASSEEDADGEAMFVATVGLKVTVLLGFTGAGGTGAFWFDVGRRGLDSLVEAIASVGRERSVAKRCFKESDEATVDYGMDSIQFMLLNCRYLR